MSQKHSCDTQCKLNLIVAARWWSNHAYLRKFFGTFRDGSNGTCCDVVQILLIAYRSEKLSIKALFDTKTILYDMIRYQHILTAMTYLRIMENFFTFQTFADFWIKLYKRFQYGGSYY